MCRRRCYRRTGRRYHKLLPPCFNRCCFTPRQFAKPCFCAIALFCGALLIAAALLAWLAKAEPQAAGSGIPQVKGAVLGVFKLRWLRILLVKFAACALAIGSGLSLGRAGPSIQMGAMAGQGVSRLLKWALWPGRA